MYCGAPMYADDLALIAESPDELQAMLNIVSSYALRWRYQLNPEKSTIMVFGESNRTRTSARLQRKWYLSGVTGYFAPQEIWHPHSISPRKMGTPSGNLAPPNVVVFLASLHAYYPRTSCTPCLLS